jgi:hypothetical protein
MTFARVAFKEKDFQIDEIGELYIALGMFFFFLSEYWNRSTGKDKIMSVFIYLFIPISLFLGVLFGILHTPWPT